jgi:GTP-binding nuclear protein Ran
MAMPTFKIVLLGDAGSGKTALMNGLLGTAHAPGSYTPTLGVEVTPLRVDVSSRATGQRLVACLNVWDTAGDERYSGLGDGYYIQADAAIICVRAPQAKRKGEKPSRLYDGGVGRWVREFRRVNPHTPIAVAFTVCDDARPVGRLPALSHVYDVCSTSLVRLRGGQGALTPFEAVLRKIGNDASLEVTQREQPRRVAEVLAFREAVRVAEETPLPDE